MKKRASNRRQYGFRQPVNPVRIQYADDVVRVQHSVQIDEDAYQYAVSIAQLRDVSVSFLLSELLEEAVNNEVLNVLKNLK